MTRRTVMLPAGANDLPTLTTLWSDTGVRELLFEGHVLTPARAQQLLEAGLAAAASGLGWWLVYPWSNGPVLGCVGLLPSPAPAMPTDAVDTMVAFSPEAWAQGYAHEALTELVQHAVHRLCVPRLAVLCGLPDPLQEGLLHTLGFHMRLEADAGQRRLRLHELDAAAARRAHQAGLAAADPAARGRMHELAGGR
jgi:Acetyltransferase (GNAT) domain